MYLNSLTFDKVKMIQAPSKEFSYTIKNVSHQKQKQEATNSAYFNNEDTPDEEPSSLCIFSLKDSWTSS